MFSPWNEPELSGPGRTAHHEAGHAVMAMSFGFEVHAISTIHRNSADGSSWITVPLIPTETDHVKLALVAAAGLAAEAHYCLINQVKNAASVGHYGDMRKAEESLRAIGHGGLFNCYVHWAHEHLTQTCVWKSLEELVKLLPEDGVLCDRQVIAEIASQVPQFESVALDKQFKLIEDGIRLGLVTTTQ